jgi:hypothetical protein
VALASIFMTPWRGAAGADEFGQLSVALSGYSSESSTLLSRVRPCWRHEWMSLRKKNSNHKKKESTVCKRFAMVCSLLLRRNGLGFRELSFGWLIPILFNHDTTSEAWRAACEWCVKRVVTMVSPTKSHAGKKIF